MFEFGAEVQHGSGTLKVWPTEGRKVALIDADMLPYIVGYTLKEEDANKAAIQIQLGAVSCLEETDFYLNAMDQVNWMVSAWVQGAGCDAAKLYLTDSAKNYRLGVAFSRPYKGKRAAEKPPLFKEMREHLLKVHGAILSDGNEADDLICIEMHKDYLRLKAEGGIAPGSPEHRVFAGVVACSKDKDLRMIPGWHFRPGDKYQKAEVFFVDEMGKLEPKWKTRKTATKGDVEYVAELKGTGLKFFYAQILMGDSVDNYPGLPGCGPQRTFELLDPLKTEQELYYAVLGEYKAKFPDGWRLYNYRGGSQVLTAYQLMLEQGRLAYMQRVPGDVWRAKSHTPHGEDDSWEK